MRKSLTTERFKRHQAARARYQLKRKKRKKLVLSRTGVRRMALRQKSKMTKARRTFISNFYRFQLRPNEVRHIKTPQHVGIEHNLDGFLDYGSLLFGKITRETNFDIVDTVRLWPSSLMLIVSYVEWVRITSGGQEKLRSIPPRSTDVEEYLLGSGFYGWVGKKTAKNTNQFTRTDVVKLEKFNGSESTKATHLKIDDLMREHSGWDSDRTERFSDVVLSEAFINVTEHGLNHRYDGWFALAQRHPTSGFISICIGDNGIGIKQSLLTGNQCEQIKMMVGSNQDDSQFIKLALEKQVSGALDSADLQKKFFGISDPSVPKGKRRGRGLKKIVACCRDLGVAFTVVSRKGAVQIGESGDTKVEHRQSACFAGTLYHFKVPIKGNSVQ